MAYPKIYRYKDYNILIIRESDKIKGEPQYYTGFCFGASNSCGKISTLISNMWSMYGLRLLMEKEDGKN